MNLEYPVTRTKILVPRRRAEIVSRQRLLDALYELLDNKLMILAAPAGYGKTSLLIDFVAHSELPHCWISLDTLDRDPQRFIAHFMAAIHVRFPKFGQTAAQALNNSTQDRLNLDALVTAIINDAYDTIREHFVIVLDDYHLVRESKQVDQFISRFIQNVDENCHLIIASRTLLTLPDLPLMVARSQVGGMSFEELAFQAEEIQAFLAQNYQRNVSIETAQDMADQTEGWITGLLLSTQMAGQEVQDRLRVAKVSGVGLYEYLAQQVLDQQPKELQSFLLRSSLLEEFDSAICEEVIGKALGLEEIDWDEQINIVLHNNLFILPLDDETLWLRYHHLFRDFLRERMQHERPEEANRIYAQLAGHHAAHGEWEQAFRLYQRLGMVDAMARMVEENGPDLIARGQYITISDWLNALPAELRDARPPLLSLQATVMVMRGEPKQGLELLNQVLAALEKTGDRSDQARSLVRRASTQRMLGEYRAASLDTVAALELIGDDLSLTMLKADALREKGILLYHQGQLNDALNNLSQAAEIYQRGHDEENSAKVSMEIGMVENVLGNYPAAEKAYGQALSYWQKTGNAVWESNLLNNLGVLQHLQGDYESATAMLEKAIQNARANGYPRLEAFSLASIGDLYRDLEATSEALDAYRWARLIARQITDRFLLLYLDLAEASMARTQGHIFQASELLHSAQQMAEESQSLYEKHLCQLEASCLRVARKEYQAAAHDLEETAHFFSTEGQRVEAVRAYLYLMVADFAAGNKQRAAECSAALFALVNRPENRHPLVTVGREVRAHLESMQGKAEFSSLIGEFLGQIDQFEERVPLIRRALRRRAVAVPFAPPKMVIRALGRMQVKINDRAVSSADWQTASCRDLFFLILAHPEGLTKEDVGAIFWPDATPAELKLRFKNNVYRVRHAVGKDAIYFQDDYYYFNRATDYEYDVETFLRDIAQAEEAQEIDKKIELYQASLKLYKGPYLPEIQETWVHSEQERLQRTYLDVLLKVAELYQLKKNYDVALNYCQRALKDDSCFEPAHRLAMRIHADMGSRAALVRQYEECRKALLDEIDAAPSAQTQDLFNILMGAN